MSQQPYYPRPPEYGELNLEARKLKPPERVNAGQKSRRGTHAEQMLILKEAAEALQALTG